jgi:dipeptidyl-peptidase-4
MMMRKTLCTILLVVLSFSVAGQKKHYASLGEALYGGMQLRGEPGPSGVTWIDGGNRYSFTRRDGGDRQIRVFDPFDQTETLIFRESDHTFPGSDKPFSYRSYQWAGDDAYLLFQTNFRPIWRYSGNADYYYYSLEEGTMRPVVEDAFTARVSPDGRKVGYGKDGDLFVFDLATETHTRLTDDAEEHFYNGRFGWAYEEEFGLVRAWEWSHDSRYIAFWQSDERMVPLYRLTDFSGQHPEYLEIPYPKVGDPPPVVRIGVLDVSAGSGKWLDIDLDGGYIPRIYWTARPHTLAVVWMNRPQDHMKLYLVDVESGEKEVVLEEQSDTWIDIFDFFAGELHLLYFPEDEETFFWISDRSGFSHIYRYDYEGRMIGQVTEGNFDVVAIEAIDTGKKRLCYLSTEVSPLEQNLFAVKFSGKGKKRLTGAPGNHRVTVAPRGQYFIDRYSDVTTPSVTELRDGTGRLVRELAGHDNTTDHLEEYEYAGRELFTFTTEDGQQIDGYLVKPMDFDSSRTYPLILDVYGGPGSQDVYNSFETSGWVQYLAQQGFVIADINNRGNGNYGRDFEKIVYRQLGKWESHDFAEAARFLAEKEWIDEARIGIMGHSYGGFSAGISLLTYPGVFRAGILTAPPADHANYDCIYTERYMGLLEENPGGYRESSLITHAGNLGGHMLLVHSLMDDNVHPQNTFQLVTALIDQGKKFGLKIFPPGHHGVAYDMNSRLLLYSEYLDFLEEHLKQGE